MDTSEIRKRYLTFFENKGHAVIASASLRPENDPTTLFVGSGMQPLLPYLLGEKHPQGVRLVNSQKCFRAEDIEEVGDNRHTTFFEMLGNWSLGDYFKEEQLSWFFEFLTDKKKGVGIPKERLWITCFEGDESLGIPKDTQSAEIWKNIGISKDHISFYDAKKNWWSRSGPPHKMPTGELGGPDSEVFYEFTSIEHDKAFGEHCHPNCDCGRFMEIGNCVFMEYIKEEGEKFARLPQKIVDFGGGLERITVASNDDADVFRTDILQSTIDNLEDFSGKSYLDQKYQKSFRIIADHLRAAMFMVDDGVLPSNTEAGYILRRLIRRAVIHADRIGVDLSATEIPSEKIIPLTATVEGIIDKYKDSFEELTEKSLGIADVIHQEMTNFRKTLTRGLKEFEKLSTDNISGYDAFILSTTHGFPFELTQELAQERGINVDESGFYEEMKAHQELSRAGSEQKFKGGLADHGEMSIKYHTATHLLNQALRQVLGDSVQQKGSNITPERMRFDFSFERKMTDEEKKQVEDIVNEQIQKAIPVTNKELPLEEAKKLGAIGLFEEKYGNMVKVYTIGDFSLEFCGGPHVTNTKQLGHFVIKKEEPISAGTRRIRAVLE